MGEARSAAPAGAAADRSKAADRGSRKRTRDSGADPFSSSTIPAGTERNPAAAAITGRAKLPSSRTVRKPWAAATRANERAITDLPMSDPGAVSAATLPRPERPGTMRRRSTVKAWLYGAAGWSATKSAARMSVVVRQLRQDSGGGGILAIAGAAGSGNGRRSRRGTGA